MLSGTRTPGRNIVFSRDRTRVSAISLSRAHSRTLAVLPAATMASAVPQAPAPTTAMLL